jgi:gamma-glutamylcyclotransferase (GGCT)/AIG2-like uncharacterized protein YtfP
VPSFAREAAGSASGEVDAERLLQSLDDYEEYSAHFSIPHEYRRCKKLSPAPKLVAWLYLYNRPVNELERIVHGD